MKNINVAFVVWLNGPGEIQIREEELPQYGDNEILCSTIVSAISPGTELAAFKGLPPLRPNVTYPRLQGYCNVAKVEATGSSVSKFSKGDRILSFQSHRSAFVIPETQALYKLPERANSDHIACAYLFHLGYNAVLRGGIRAGSRVLIIGLGVLGLTTVANAAVAGADVYALSDYSVPTEIAMQFGAVSVFQRKDLGALKEAIKPDLVDVVIVTTNSWSDWNIALQMVGQLGVIAVLGFPGRGERISTKNPLESQYFYMKQIRIEAVGFSPELPDGRGFCRFNERNNIEYICRQIMSGRLNPESFISGRFEATNIKEAYNSLMTRQSSPLTYLLEWKH